MKEATTTLLIEAPIDVVWEVMTAIEDYPTWNPFIYKIEADGIAPKEGGEMTFLVQFEKGNKTKSKEVVTVFLPPTNTNPSTAQWVYEFKGFLPTIGMVRANRIQQLEVLPNGHTTYTTSEKFTGWGQALVPLAQVQKGFEIQAAALKKKCEDVQQQR